ncbi:regulatory protein, luxR family [Mucilaginibacter mallensis]|uniref:Regulatory protein, luxR family n=1 Tax=Mucilaginibacter mallensis TaxID=652787 RepID=A0A1H1VQS3_MUCMA|nr:LuxR C-terminal-related transcriptional regulator [Mucilaginibacter mallensis]SDS87102.1 regulatory protein, luxR family [Mucilaginibacter mallensis]
MNLSTIKIIIKIGLVTAGIIILFEATSLLFIYKYFKFDYYLSAVALFFLLAGYTVSKYNTAAKKQSTVEPDPFLNLTNKEQHILQLIIEGKSNKEIAALNYVEVSTIKTHINNIYAKLGLNNRKEAITQYKTRFATVDYANIHPFST